MSVTLLSALCGVVSHAFEAFESQCSVTAKHCGSTLARALHATSLKCFVRSSPLVFILHMKQGKLFSEEGTMATFPSQRMHVFHPHVLRAYVVTYAGGSLLGTLLASSVYG